LAFYSYDSGQKLQIDLSVVKNWGEKKFKIHVKKCRRQNCPEYWQHKKTSGLVSGKLTTFYKIKECFRREPYLSVLNSVQRNLITKFRISAHQLRIKTGRFERKKNQAGKISILEREERVCLYCNLSKVEDESHFLLECPLYNHERSFFFNEIGSICEFFLSLNNHDKFYWILNNEDYKILSIFSTFLKTCFSLRKQ
jgi:hypothetical protein